MRMVDLIELKKNNHELTKEQIHFIIKGYNRTCRAAADKREGETYSIGKAL